MRGILGQLAVIVLFYQGVAISLPTAALLTNKDISNCTCTTGDHATCPMHHHGSKSDCAIRAADEDHGQMLVPLTFVGVIPVPSELLVVEQPSSERLPFGHQTLAALQIPPEPPPPRT